MKEKFRIGTKVRFIPELQHKYDEKEHTVLSMQTIKEDDDTSYFLHYWYWVDEDELELV